MMMNNKIFNGRMGVLCLMALSMGFALSACTFEQEDFFDESASLRLTHVNEQIKDRLVAQSDTTQGKHGWVIQYFVAGTDDYDFEGFNLFGRFYDSGKVTLAGNHRFLRNGQANKYTEHSSTYEMLSEEGSVLSFNTWNDILTVFEDPVDPTAAPGSLVNNGEGMYGDHNLVLSGLADNELNFRGERHRANIRFIPADRPWQEYIEAVAKTKNQIAPEANITYRVTNNVDTMYFSGLHRGYFNYCDRVEDPLVNTVLSCVFTPNGIRLKNTTSLGDNTFQELTISQDSTELVSEDGQVHVQSVWEPYFFGLLNQNVNNSMLAFDYESLSEAQKGYYDVIARTVKTMNATYDLRGVGIGKTTSGGNVTGLSVVYYTNAAHTRTQILTLGLELSQHDGTGITIGFDESNASANNNMQSLINRFDDFATAIRSLASSLQGTYSITPDNYFVPSGATFQPVGSGSGFRMVTAG